MDRKIINQLDAQTRRKYDLFEKNARKSVKNIKRNNYIAIYITTLNVFWFFCIDLILRF